MDMTSPEPGTGETTAGPYLYATTTASSPQPAPEHPGGVPGQPQRPAATTIARWRDKVRPATAAWLGPALVMAAFGLVGVGRPGLWADELATWGAVTLPARQMIRMLGAVDAVLGPYYAGLAGWTRLVGDSDVALRLPSVVAMTVAAALLGVLGTQLAGPRAGLTAGTLFALLPVVSRYGQEARPYAFAVMFALLATVLLMRFIERPGMWRLVAYAVAVALLGLSNIVALLLLGAHGALMLAGGQRRLTLQWLAAAAVGVLPALPLALAGSSQTGQVSWISSFETWSMLYWLPVMYLIILGGSLLGGIIVCVLVARARPRRLATWLLLTWALLPPVALLAISPVVDLVLPRYLLFVLPAWIMLAGIALSQYRIRWTAIVLVLIAVCAVPQQWAMRTPAGHENQGTRELAAAISQYARPGDGIVYGQYDAKVTCCVWLARDAVAHYVPADRRPVDLFLQRAQRVDGELQAVEYPNAQERIGVTPRIWVVRLQRPSDPLVGLGDGKEEVLRQHYRQVWQWLPSSFTLSLLMRTG